MAEGYRPDYLLGQEQLYRDIARKHVQRMREAAEDNGCPDLARRIEEREPELIRVLTLSDEDFYIVFKRFRRWPDTTAQP